MTSKFMSAVHQKASCTTKDDPRRDPSWGKAEKLKNLKVKTIRPKTWHGLQSYRILEPLRGIQGQSKEGAIRGQGMGSVRTELECLTDHLFKLA
jgi:hypothetical protein